MLQHVANQALVEGLRGDDVRPDGAEHSGRPQRLEEALDRGDVDVDQDERQAQPGGTGGVEKVGALPDGVAGGVPFRKESPRGRDEEGRGGRDQS